jgi:predicted porin
MRPPARRPSLTALCTLAALPVSAVLAAAGAARAGIVVYDKEAWSLSIDGRAQGFYSFATGDAAPTGATSGVALAGEAPIAAIGDDEDRFITSRMRGGWAGSLLGATVKNEISDTLTAVARLSYWFTIEGDQTKGAANAVGSLDIRQGFVKLESASLGGLLLGRELGLHSRGSLLQAALLTADDYSVGSPCSITGLGITCGQVGYGVLMPGFNAGIVYNTPELSGFTLSVGAYDPVRVGPMGIGPQSYGQTPLPRFEGELVYHLARGAFAVDAFVNGMWQRLVKTGGDQTLDPMGVGYGGRITVGGARLGFVGGRDKGGGMSVPLADVQIDPAGHLRIVTTYWGQAGYVLGNLELTAGVGVALNRETALDAATPAVSVIKSHLGINAALLYRLGPVTLVAQYFRMQHRWHRGEEQVANLVNTGATFNW